MGRSRTVTPTQAQIESREARLINLCDKCFRYLETYPRLDLCKWKSLNCHVCDGLNVKQSCEDFVSTRMFPGSYAES